MRRGPAGVHRAPRLLGTVAALAPLVVAVTVAVATVLVFEPVSASAAPPTTRTVGEVSLVRCGVAPPAYCGHRTEPLDRADPGSPGITVAFRWYPATAPVAGTAPGTVLPVEGGPGYPSTGSVRGGFDTMYGALLSHWNLLAVDLRGTGGSTPLDCPALRNWSGQPSGSGYAAAAGSCASGLDHRWRDASGRWVHASDLFTSAPAAADVADIVRALGLGRVDLYGDSYGSWFAQVVASRYPSLFRSVVLDSTYSTVTLDPWYRSSHDSMPAAMDAACTRAPACAAAGPGSAWDRVATLATRLRAAPVSASVPDATGTVSTVTLGVVGLIDLVNDAAGDPRVYRSLDAAGRALMDDQDPTPLLRLYAERLASDEAYTGLPARSYSGELYLAVSCLDYPQLFSMASPPGDRVGQLDAAVATLAPGTFAPFTTSEWVQQDQNTEAYTACADWPMPRSAEPPTTGTLPLLPPRMPVLVLGAEFDTWTPPVDAPGILAQLGGHHRFVSFANATHVVGQGDQPCASTVVQAFVQAPGHLDSIDTSCAAAVPPIRTVGRFAGSLADVAPIDPGPGSAATADGLRAAAAAVATAGDAVTRSLGIGAVPDVGLHGGTVVPTRGASRLTLASDALVPGIAVSGTVEVRATLVVATLSVSGSGAPATMVTVTWPTSGAGAVATVSGTSDGMPIRGSCPAP